METFCKLFGSLLAFVYHCFDRIVIQGHLPLATRPEHIVHFFRDVHSIYPITKQALRQRTQEYQQWVEAFARNDRIPIEWADTAALKAKGLTREDVPVDAVTQSASGVDPQISEANALIQAHRVAAVRGLSLERVEGLISDHTDDRFLGVLGEPGVNVLQLNIALEEEAPLK